MKIALFFEHRDIGSSGYYVERALHQLGHEVDHFTRKDLGSISPKYDLYLRIEDGEFGYQFRSLNLRPAVYWTHDTHVPFSWKKIQREAREYDFFFAAHQSGMRRLRNFGYPVEWLSFGCDIELHGRVDVPIQYEVSSIGKEEGIPRKFLLQEIRERHNPTFIQKAHFSRMRTVYSASKIGFNQAINRDVNMRVYEVLCSGAMLLTSEVEENSYEKLGLMDKKHLVVFHSPRELFELLNFYLTHDKERRAIANEGYRLACAKHTYRHRMEELLSVLHIKKILRESALKTV